MQWIHFKDVFLFYDSEFQEFIFHSKLKDGVNSVFSFANPKGDCPHLSSSWDGNKNIKITPIHDESTTAPTAPSVTQAPPVEASTEGSTSEPGKWIAMNRFYSTQ